MLIQTPLADEEKRRMTSLQQRVSSLVCISQQQHRQHHQQPEESGLTKVLVAFIAHKEFQLPRECCSMLAGRECNQVKQDCRFVGKRAILYPSGTSI